MLVGLRVAGGIAEKKLSRDLEHDADAQGMLLMARAGYKEPPKRTALCVAAESPDGSRGLQIR